MKPLKEALDFLARRRAAKKLQSTDEHGPRPRIERGVPVPAELRGGPRHFAHFYPFEDMEIGDSFWVPGGTTCTNGAAMKFGEKTGWQFRCRAETRDGRRVKTVGSRPAPGKPHERGTRVWRIK